MPETPSTVADHVVVSLDYTLTVNGEMVDSSNGHPLEYLQGHQNIIAGLERALAGMKIGETKDVVVAPADAYGEYNPAARISLDRAQLPPNFQANIGDRLHVRDDEGKIYNAGVIGYDDQSLHLDLNHPMAGKELHFKATIAGLREAKPEELAHGQVGGCASCGSGGCDSSEEGCSDGCCSGGGCC